MKKSFIAGLAGTLVLGLATSAFAFTDVTSSHWAKKYVDKLAELKVVNGVSETAFNPNGKVTRAEFAKMIVEAKGLDKENPATPTFTDVDADKWYYGYVEAAAKAGYVNGIGEGKFAPNANITRQEIAKIIVEAAGLKADDSKALTFADAADISDWAKGYVAVAAEEKFVEGYNNKFSPKNNATRAEAAKLVYSEMVYEGKIVEEEEIPVGYYKVTDTPSKGATDIELNDESYELASPFMKIAGEFVSDIRVFQKGTLVKVTLNDDDEIESIEADGNVVKGEVTETGSNSDGDDTITIDGKEYVWDDDAPESNAGSDANKWDDADILAYSDITQGDNYIVLLNASGEAYAAFADDAKTYTGELTAKGVNSDDKYYVVVGTTKYYSEEDFTEAQMDALITVNGDASKGWDDLKTGDMVVEVKTNNSGEIKSIEAYDKEITGQISAIMIASAASKQYVVFDGKNYTNLRRVGSAVYLGEETTKVDGTWNLVTTPANFRPMTKSVDITKDGVEKDFAKLTTGDTVKATVNTDGKVTKVVVTDDKVMGQVSAFEENDDDEVISITVNGKKYELENELLNEIKSARNAVYGHAIGDDLIFKGVFVNVTLNNDGEVELDESDVFILNENDDEEIATWDVLATPTKKGRVIGKDEEAYAGNNTLSIMDEDSVISNFDVSGYTIVKDGVEIKISAITLTDTIAINPVDKYIVVNPIQK